VLGDEDEHVASQAESRRPFPWGETGKGRGDLSPPALAARERGDEFENPVELQ
jgi:hypothetical protein